MNEGFIVTICDRLRSDAVAWPIASDPIQRVRKHLVLSPKIWCLIMRLRSIYYRNTLSRNP
ncbi:hypothetical protein EMEDMD4_90231 [Sinorhizobium medicae]|uniref:Uncharacterized protein n=1 Tax=Sinorhizobium medicae TaxID=110321 RepID=A0A508X7J1_9HYPH|nr:hypothetical protein EMEDMD4_90231 [Sinorhizobium medicae]